MPLLRKESILQQQLEEAQGRIRQLELINDKAHGYVGQLLDELHRLKKSLKNWEDQDDEMRRLAENGSVDR